MSESTEVRVTLQLEEGYAFRVHFEGTDLEDMHTDEPGPLGKGSGPDPTRMLLAAIANCLSASLLFAMRKFKNSPVSLHTVITARSERNADGRWRIPKAEVELQLAEGSGSHEHLESILAQFENYCVVTQSVREGIQIEVTVKDADGRVLLGDKTFEGGS